MENFRTVIMSNLLQMVNYVDSTGVMHGCCLGKDSDGNYYEVDSGTFVVHCTDGQGMAGRIVPCGNGQEELLYGMAIFNHCNGFVDVFPIDYNELCLVRGFQECLSGLLPKNILWDLYIDWSYRGFDLLWLQDFIRAFMGLDYSTYMEVYK